MAEEAPRHHLPPCHQVAEFGTASPRDFLDDEWQAPSEDIHEIGQVIGVGGAIVLQHVQRAVVEF